MPLINARGFKPTLENDVFITESSQIIGDVLIQAGSSVWFNTTLRGDVMPIRIGSETNIQDGSVLHGTFGKFACEIGNRVTIGHSVILHGCKIGNSCLIGMGSIVMDGAVIADQCVVGAGSLVTEGKQFSAKSLIMGRPAKFIRVLNDDEINFLEQSADNYLLYKTWYK
ncbi:MAG: gamma carbonic anhydrase family protein [Pseudobdellovibrio sp.]